MAFTRQENEKIGYSRIESGSNFYAGIGNKSFNFLDFSFNNVTVSFGDITKSLLYTKFTGSLAPSTVRVATALSPTFSKVGEGTSISYIRV